VLPPLVVWTQMQKVANSSPKLYGFRSSSECTWSPLTLSPSSEGVPGALSSAMNERPSKFCGALACALASSTMVAVMSSWLVG
jgi:hypothetical protein